MSLRCLCLPDESLSQIITRVKKIKSRECDLIEIGISSMKKTEWESAVAHMFNATKHPLMLASRGEKLTQETVQIYEAALDAGWKWIDVDMSSPKKYIQQLTEKIIKKKARLILSTHLKSTPSISLIQKKIEHMHTLKAIPKVVTTITKEKNLITLLHTLALFKKRPVILHGIGVKSRESRLLQAAGGSAITYLCLEPKLATAKGQWTIDDWNRTIRAL